VWSNTPDDHVAVRGFVASGFLDPIHPGCVDDPVVMVGFTHTVWNDELVPDDGTSVPPGSVLFHIGGWKHLADQAVSKARFNEEAHKRGFTRVVDCYAVSPAWWTATGSPNSWAPCIWTVSMGAST
jgi:hypothetical protein